MVLSQVEYDRLYQLEHSQKSHSHEYLCCLTSQTLDIRFRTSSHMTNIKDKFINLHLFNKFSSVNIVDGTQSLIFGDGIVQATPSLNLSNVLYVSKFHVSLLSINQFTKQNNCSITIFPSYCLSGPTIGRMIDSGCER